jgi:3',5'-cyclic AMP phosphodiesterase CpdA
MAPSGVVVAAQPASPVGGRRRSLRFAHPTDSHVWAKNHGAEGMAAAFAHMMALPDRPEMVIHGGDCPMDSASTPYADSREEWGIFTGTIAKLVPAEVTVWHTLGNHDVFGRDKEACEATGSEAYYGKKWFLSNFGYERTYRSFDRAGWHFVQLDSIDWTPESKGKDFVARIGGEQLEWLRADLAASKGRNTVVISHVPIMSVANFFDGEKFEANDETFELRSSRMHVDCRDLEAMFREHGGVKLCLSGHLHLLDKCVYNGITYICDGAVSSNKWKGVRRQTPNGYGVIDLFEDGTFEHQYVTYGWKT